MSNRPRLGAWPAKTAGQPGEIGVCRVPDDTAADDLVARVPDQLGAEDPGPGPVRRVRREHSDHRPDPAAVGGLTQVRHRLGGDVRCRSDLAAVPHPQALPVQPPDASRAVPPGDTRAEGELSRRLPVRARRLDLAANLPDPPVGRPEVILLVEQRDELLGAGHQAVGSGRAIARHSPPRRAQGQVSRDAIRAFGRGDRAIGQRRKGQREGRRLPVWLQVVGAAPRLPATRKAQTRARRDSVLVRAHRDLPSSLMLPHPPIAGGQRPPADGDCSTIVCYQAGRSACTRLDPYLAPQVAAQAGDPRRYVRLGDADGKGGVDGL